MSLQSHLNQFISVFPKTSFDEYGREVSGSQVNYHARVQEISRDRTLANNQVITISALCFLDGDPAVEENDKLTYNGTTYRVFGKKSAVDGQGNVHHVTLQLTKHL